MPSRIFCVLITRKKDLQFGQQVFKENWFYKRYGLTFNHFSFHPRWPYILRPHKFGKSKGLYHIG